MTQTADAAPPLIACDQERIHMPGAIQPHGALIVARLDHFTITHVSENLPDYLGVLPKVALGHHLTEVLGEAACQAVRNAVTNERLAPDVVVAVSAPAALFPLQMVAHTTNGSVIMEFEAAPPSRNQGLAIERTQAIMHALHAADSQRELCQIVVTKLREMTGHHRAMVYRFDPAGNGKVIAEDREDGLESYIGLHYPASDIPSQAHRVYLAQQVRSIADVDYVGVPILTDPALGQIPPLDMTLCALRSVSPTHLEYMRNMGTRASLGVSLIPGRSLWGMLVCHHRSPLVITASLRSQCGLIGKLMSLLLRTTGERETHADQLRRQCRLHEIVARANDSEHVADALLASEDAILSMLDATGAVIQLGQRTVTLGLTPSIEATMRAVAKVSGGSDGGLIAIDELQECVPDWAAESATASGALYLPLPPNAGDAITWFRPETEQLIMWGGDPAKAVDPTTGRLSPRRSFALWPQRVAGQSEPWTEVDQATAREIGRVVTAILARHAVIDLDKARHYDPLTQLPNRLMLQERLYKLGGASDVALALLDLDRFKAVNDIYGFGSDDLILLQVAARLTKAVRNDDLVVRLGGDEFAILCCGINVVAAHQLAERLRKDLAEGFVIGDQTFFAGASVGVAHTDMVAVPELLDAASLQRQFSRADLLAGIRARDGKLSPREAIEARLIESEERFRLILQSPVVEAVYLLDPHGIIESWNASAERIKGYSSSEIIGRNFSTFFTPEDIASGEPARILDIAAKTGRFTAEGERVRKNGSRFLGRIAIDAVRRPDGTLRGFVKVSTDITDQRLEEEQRAILIEASPNGMMIVDEAGIIRLVNRRVEAIFGYPQGLLIGQSVEALVPDNMQSAHEALRSEFTGGQNVRAMATGREFTGRRWDGGHVAVEIFLNPIKTPRGQVVVASLFDVTEQRRLASEKHDAAMRERLAIEETNASLDRLSRELAKARDHAEQANRAKSRFLAGMSHELRTPLNGIMGYAHLLHMEGGLTITQEQRVNAMLVSGKHLLEMIACVLDLSEIEAGHASLRVVTFDPKAIVTACLDLVRPAAEATGLALSFAVTPSTPDTIAADPTRLRQVLLNLLGNAIKFTSQGRVTVQLRTAADGSTLRLEVEDTGPGIPADQKQRLFNDFDRLDSEATSKAEGAGLGLAISSRLAALMGGRLGHSDNPNGGSVFWLELPLDALATAIPDAAPALEPPDEPPLKLTRPLTVLLVDDVLMNREVAGSFLRAGGHQVTCAESGAEAIAAAAGTDFDVVLMDVRMPEMDGLEATRRIRALAGARGQVPIVALTAQAFTDQIAECRKAGMDSHLAKPFEPATLLAAVKRAVDAGHQHVDHGARSVPTTVPAGSIHSV